MCMYQNSKCGSSLYESSIFFISLQILIYQSQNSMYEYMPLVTSPSKYYFRKQFVLECQNFNP